MTSENFVRDLGCRHRVHHMGPTLVVGTVHRRWFEAKIVEMSRIRKNLIFLCPHRRHHLRQPVELGVKNGAHDLRCPSAVRGEGHKIFGTSGPVVVTWVNDASNAFVKGIVIDDYAPTFTSTDVLEVVEAVGTSMPDGAQHPSFVPTANALTSVFNHQQIVLLCDTHDCIHVARGTPDMNWDERPWSAVRLSLRGHPGPW